MQQFSPYPLVTRMAARLIIALLICAALGGVRHVPPVAHAQSVNRIALFVIVDSSGSMDDNDGSNRRWTAVKLLTSLLSDGDKLALISFGDSVNIFPDAIHKSYGPLITIGSDGRSGTMDKATLLNDIDSFAPNVQRGSTNMRAAFDALTPLITSAGVGSDARPYVVFLTDGLPNKTPENSAENLTAQAKSWGAPLYANGLFVKKCLSQDAEAKQGMQLLRSLGDNTGGSANCVNSVDQLPEFFLKSFGNLAYRSYHRPVDGKFEVTVQQEELIASATLVYVDNAGRCGEDLGATLCTTIKNPSTGEETAQSLNDHQGMKLLRDPNFLALSMDAPRGAWQLGDPTNWHIIVRTNVRMDIGLPNVAASFTRRPVDQPLGVEVQFHREDTSDERIMSTIGEPVFAASIQSLEPDATAQSLAPPTRTGTSFRGEIPPQTMPGRYRVSVEANIFGFTFREEQEISVEPFPSFRAAGLTDNRVVVARGEKAALRLETVIDGRPAPVVIPPLDAIQLICDNRTVPIDIQQAGATAVEITFDPPGQQQSDCQLDIAGELEYLEVPYTLSAPTVSMFGLLVQPVLHLDGLTHDMGDVLPFTSLVLPGPRARLVADANAELTAEVKIGQGSDWFRADVQPKNIINNDTTPLKIELQRLDGVELPYDRYEVVIVITPNSQLSTPEGRDLRYTFNVVQPQIKHSLTPMMELDTPFAEWDEAALTIPFQVESTLANTDTLDVDVQQTAHLMTELLSKDQRPPHDLPLNGTREIALQIAPADGVDVFPRYWFKDRPIDFQLEVRAGKDVNILPQPVVHVVGTRLSVWNGFLRDYAGPIGLGQNVLLALFGVWLATLLAWGPIEQRNYRKPSHYLVPVTIHDHRTAPDPYSTPMALESGSSALKHRLFGVRLSNLDRRSWRSWRPQSLKRKDLWYWLIGGGRPDFNLPASAQGLDFRITSNDMDGSVVYRIKNLNAAPLELLGNNQIQKLETGQEEGFRPGDVILMDDERGLELRAESTAEAVYSDPEGRRAGRRGADNETSYTAVSGADLSTHTGRRGSPSRRAESTIGSAAPSSPSRPASRRSGQSSEETRSQPPIERSGRRRTPEPGGSEAIHERQTPERAGDANNRKVGRRNSIGYDK